MKILTVGTIVKDIIHHFNGTQSYSLGGLTYTIAALLSLVGDNDVIIPVSYIGEDVYSEILKMYENKPQIQSNGFIMLRQPNNAVELTYVNPVDRQECSRYPFPEIPFSDIEPFLGADVLLLNLISGWDIALQTLVKIRQRFSGFICLDLHSLTLGRKSDGMRYLRNTEAGDWIKHSDIIQANEREFKAIGGDPGNPELFFREICFKEGKIFNLTRSHRGSSSFYWEDGNLNCIDAAPAAEMKVIDPTGCGDAFMAGFIFDYYINRDIEKAAKAANLSAAITGAFKGLYQPDHHKKQKGN